MEMNMSKYCKLSIPPLVELWHSAITISDQAHSRESARQLGGCSVGLKTILLFIWARCWRGGLRALAQALVSLLAVSFILANCFDESILDIVLGQPIGDALCYYFTSQDPRESAVEEGGGLRIVVFGAPDLANSVPSKESNSTEKSWTENLCDQVP
jgi:hypothetical protein